jgi:anti-sigma regulatory factor (Ser/Thr protein kinase)
MPSVTSLAVPLSDSTQVAVARRAATALARQIGMGETVSGQLAIVVTEAATNVIKHGGGGDILLTARERRGVYGVEMLALDKGPGMADLQRCAEDGYSTGGSPGNGLGAIRRLAAFHDIFSAPGLGTVVMAWVQSGPPPSQDGAPSQPFQTGAVCVPMPGEEICGDAWIASPRAEGIRLLMADGLGHGLGAAQAALCATGLAASHPADSTTDLLSRVHDGLRATRGAAVAAAEIDVRAAVVRYTGLGNIAGSILAPDSPRRQMVSHNGTAGHHARKLQEFTFPWAHEALLILHSDGISSHWSLDKYPGLFYHHPSVIAGLLYRDFARGRDDASVVVVRQPQSGKEFA